MITFTLDLEDHRSDLRYEKRYPEILNNILTLLDNYSIKGTFFIVGTVIKNDPKLVRKIAEQGHEVAFHSYSHVQLNDETPENFKKESHIGKELLEDVHRTKGFRISCPGFFFN